MTMRISVYLRDQMSPVVFEGETIYVDIRPSDRTLEIVTQDPGKWNPMARFEQGIWEWYRIDAITEEEKQ